MPKKITRQKRNGWLHHMISMLPDAIDKDRGSNVVKLLKVINFQIVKARFEAERVESWRDIELARGKALDKIGKQYGVSRGNSDDEFYRVLIRFKQAQSHADGSVNSLIKVISNILGADPKDIHINNFPNEPQAIVIDNIPNRYVDSDQKIKMVIQQLENSVAAGIKIAGVHFNDHTQFTIYVGSYLSNFTKYKIPTEEDVTKYHLGTALTTYVSTYGSSFTKYRVPNEEDESIYHLGSTTPVYVAQTMTTLTKYKINERKVS